MKTRQPLRFMSESSWCRLMGVCGAVLVASVLGSVGTLARAQVAAPTPQAMAQRNYEAQVAQCNAGGLSAGTRGECLQAAQNTMVQASRGQPSGADTRASTDGRSSIVPLTVVPAVPQSMQAPEATANGVTSADGRATIMPPPVISQ